MFGIFQFNTDFRQMNHKPIRLAATILLGRDYEGDFEVLLLKRNKALAFAGGLWVFPGGKVESEELEQTNSEIEAARIAAIRETKEEANLNIKSDQLTFFHHWTTPVVEPRRFATYFFYGKVEEGNTNVQIDDGEIKEHIWIRPQEAIKNLRAGELSMLPPTLMSLQLISHCKTAQEAFDLLEKKEPQYILPVLKTDGSIFHCLYEGDVGYESGNIDEEGARHRLILDMAKGDFYFEYENCLHIPPINGQDEKRKVEPIQIQLPLGIMFPSVNAYLIEGEKLTLVDCGMNTAENWETLQKELAKNGCKVGDIEQVVITHEHIDHIGLLPQILENSEAIVRAPKMIEGWFSRPDDLRVDYLAFAERLYKSIGFPKGVEEKVLEEIQKFRKFPTMKDMSRFEFFEEGDWIEMGFQKWQAVHTPGHCPTQFVFIDEKQKRVFGGDMLLPIAPMPIVNEDPNRKGKPIRALRNLLDSYELMKTYDFKKVYPGHGPIFTNANEVIDAQMARIEMRKKECLEHYKAGAKTVYEIHRKMYPAHHVPPNFSGIYMIFGYLDLLAEEGMVLPIEL